MPTHGSLSKAGKTSSLTGLKKTGRSLGSIQGLRTRGNTTTASSWKETPAEEGLKVVNMNSANGGIEGDEEDDSWSVQVPFVSYGCLV